MSEAQPTTTYLETISNDTDTPQTFVDSLNPTDPPARTAHAHHDGPATQKEKQKALTEAPVTPDLNKVKQHQQQGGEGHAQGQDLYATGGLLQFGLGP
ncbi:hypothetical protein HDV00_001869 [Rhizophlyctis rosea]|nr:hypothetical protein HDV00_001869 [Rhizophlyctis rosea]